MALPAYSNPALIEKAVGATLPAADVNKILGMINAAFGSVGPAWVDFTPTVTQSVGITITVTVARYAIIGKTALVEFRLLLSSAGTAGNNIVIASIPAAIQPKTVGASGQRSSGLFLYSDTGTGFRVGAIVPVSTTTWQFITDNGTAFLGINPALTIANGDIISGFAVYEIA